MQSGQVEVPKDAKYVLPGCWYAYVYNMSDIVTGPVQLDFFCPTPGIFLYLHLIPPVNSTDPPFSIPISNASVVITMQV